jgi:Nucleotidyl transferase AbiEii toxin, Type IV TA system
LTLFRDFAPLDDSAEAAAALVGDVDSETLVKDYWVTQALRVLADEYSGLFAFKGGTSLTKALKCVDRFSEDIDILITGRPEDMSFDRLMKSIAGAVSAITGLAGERVGGTTNEWRSVRFTYSTRHESVLKPEILLEMGVRGRDDPLHVVREVGPLLADVKREGFEPSDYPDLGAFSVDVLHPARTLWEKVVLLHNDVTTGRWRDQEPSRFARHYGDVGALLALNDVRDALDGRGVRSHLDEDVREVSARWFGGEPPPPPEGGYASSEAFVLSDEFREYLDKHFAEAVATLWSPSNRPSLDHILRTVQDNAEILNPSEV